MDYKQQQTRSGKVRRGRRRYRGSRPYNRTQLQQHTASSNAEGPIKGTIQAAGYVIRSMPLFGYRVRKQLNYFSSGIVISGASGLANAQVFSANGIFDPDITGTGGQPMSFDQMMVFFNHYTVHSALMKVTFSSDSPTLRALTGLFVSGSSSVTTSVETLLENGDGAVQQLQFAGAYGSSCTFTRRLDAGKFQSVPNVLDDPNMRGDSASNPTEQSYFHLMVANVTTAATVQCEYNCIITYDVTFHEPRKGTLS